MDSKVYEIFLTMLNGVIAENYYNAVDRQFSGLAFPDRIERINEEKAKIPGILVDLAEKIAKRIEGEKENIKEKIQNKIYSYIVQKLKIQKRKIECIKEIRKLTNCTLFDAKTFCEKIEGMTFEKKQEIIQVPNINNIINLLQINKMYVVITEETNELFVRSLDE